MGPSAEDAASIAASERMGSEGAGNTGWFHPTEDPGTGAATDTRPAGPVEWGGQPVSTSGVFNALRRHGLNTLRKRLSLVAGYAAPPEPERAPRPETQHLDAAKPEDLGQFDCFHIGRLCGTKDIVWQSTAIDVASSYLWAESHTAELKPGATHTSALARRVADELAAAGWQLEAVLTDNGSEFRSQEFGNAVRARHATQRFIRAGRPWTNGCVESVQRTILEECWRPTFARSLVPKPTAFGGTWSSTSTSTTRPRRPQRDAGASRSAGARSWDQTAIARRLATIEDALPEVRWPAATPSEPK